MCARASFERSGMSSTMDKLDVSAARETKESKGKKRWNILKKAVVTAKIFHGRTVRVAINFDHIYSMDTQNQTFTASFTAIYEWHDSSLKKYSKADDVDWSKHFWPTIQFQGAIEISEPEMCPRIHDLEEGIAKLTARFQGTFSLSLNLQHFPFDVHTLNLHLKARKWGGVNADSRTVRLVNFSTDMKGSANRKHKMSHHAASAVPEFDVILPADAGLEGVGKNGTEYMVRLLAVRRSQSVMTNVGIFITMIQCLSFTAFWLDPKEDLADRLGVVLTLLLTVVAFKLMVKEDLPAVPYMTDMDKYILAATFMLFFQALMHTLPVEYGQLPWVDDTCFHIMVAWFAIQHVWTAMIVMRGISNRDTILNGSSKTTIRDIARRRKVSLSPVPEE